MLIYGIDSTGHPVQIGAVGNLLKVATDVENTTPEVVASEQDLTAAYAAFGDAQLMTGYKVLGVHVNADCNASQDVILRVMGMLDASDTPFPIDALSSKTLWSGVGTDFEKYFEFETGILPYVIVQVIAGTVGNVAAYMTGGTAAQATYGTWEAIIDGSYRIGIDGTDYNVDGNDFTGVTNMDGVATILQTNLRVATGGSELVVWSTDHFIITSGISTDLSEVTVTDTSTGTVGTDISGAGAADWMDSDTGNGVETAVVNAGDLTLTFTRG